MEKVIETEYEMLHKEIVEVRTCITDYMQMFFGVGIGVIGLFAYLGALEFDPSSNSTKSISLAQSDWGYIPLALGYVVLSFTTILFHKFNTHNRGCGYMRAMEQERHNVNCELGSGLID